MRFNATLIGRVHCNDTRLYKTLPEWAGQKNWTGQELDKNIATLSSNGIEKWHCHPIYMQTGNVLIAQNQEMHPFACVNS
jgi:hypothetical protein